MASSRPPESESGGTRTWLVLGLSGVGILLAVALGIWLIMGGTATLMRWLPEGVARTLGEKPGEGKRVMQTLSEYPGEGAMPLQPGESAGSGAGEAASGTDDPPSIDEVEAAMAPIQIKADAADEAITRVRGGSGRDQAAAAEAEKAIEAVAATAPAEVSRKATKVAQDRRRLLVTEKRAALESAKRLARATHLITGEAKLRSAADGGSEVVASLMDGALVRVYLDTGKGWSRADVISGPAAGKAGYLPNAVLKRLAGTVDR